MRALSVSGSIVRASSAMSCVMPTHRRSPASGGLVKTSRSWPVARSQTRNSSSAANPTCSNSTKLPLSYSESRSTGVLSCMYSTQLPSMPSTVLYSGQGSGSTVSVPSSPQRTRRWPVSNAAVST